MYQVLLFKSRRHLCKGSMTRASALFISRFTLLHERFRPRNGKANIFLAGKLLYV